MSGPQGTFTGVSGTIGTAEMSSIAASLASQFSATASGTSTATQTSDQTSATATNSNAATATTDSTPITSQTTFSTSTTAATEATSTLPQSIISTASNAASSTTGAVTVSEKSCSSLSCHPGLKAAIAVPIVIAALAGLFLLFFFARRRRRKDGAVVSEKKPRKAGKGGWSRHLRAFSFDAELLMGGRFSGSNSLRSRDPSVRSAGTNSRTGAASAEPSLHSIEEVAPPYRDAISHAQVPISIQTGAAGPVAAGEAVASAADPIPRSTSTATAPPPYRSVVGDPRSPLTPVSGNPFADSAPVSPIEGSPFNDPPEEDGRRPAISRGSSLYRSVNTEDGAPSDAGSIREAQVGRRVSVRTSGTPPRSST
ncbi:hypothetical protein LTR10_016982 [Elasticomyces elasticus]|uniref:Uncharacterized protein n=1 Tax=Exophiala sideris TaxID=1016849 RepID=A0ABR0JFB7_9EURO|nr:hypothetical protein LTR10_016982 [Elasticomyces elasticus]KAK5025236.1 hypothetical protein LTS07_008087 [Exophiala sideris]KAK5029216.1 hypothetical protein LTR13_008753 [Exophiala sideris]KAK5063295.1 hypothetical protein LTR69_004001 [Exophiala sideris]KAK5179011.1 hypothetical protein LTR44_008500 [Eurotiomycetes sp. CCFEE 6388]